MILADWQITDVLVTPCMDKLRQEGVVSYGKSSFGYDIRLGHNFLVPGYSGEVLDPKKISVNGNESDFFEHSYNPGSTFVLDPGDFVLGETMERFKIPRNTLALCLGKSTYARCGIIVNVTPLEPGWEGVLTLEIHNASRRPVRLYCGEGIAQVIFLKGKDCDVSYADRKGKYQNQTGVTAPKISSK